MLAQEQLIYTIRKTSVRFPVSLGAAVPAALLFGNALVYEDNIAVQTLAGINAVLWAIAAELLLEGRRVIGFWRFLAIVPVCLSVVLVGNQESGTLGAVIGIPLAFAGGLTLLFASTNPGRSTSADGWGRLRETAVSAAIALGLSLTGCIGATAAVYLFDFLLWSVSGEAIVWIWSLGMVFGSSVVFLARLRLIDSDPIPPGRSYRGFFLWLLFPLTTIYVIILHAFALRFLPFLSLPDGGTGWTVAPFLAVVFILLHGLRGIAETRWVAMILRWGPASIPVPAILILLAASDRISVYGWTEARYYLVLLGSWALFVSIGWLLRPQWSWLRWQTGSLAILLALSAFGPWSASGIAIASQTDILNRIFAEALPDHTLGEEGGSGTNSWRNTRWPGDWESHERLADVRRWLNRRHALPAVLNRDLASMHAPRPRPLATCRLNSDVSQSVRNLMDVHGYSVMFRFNAAQPDGGPQELNLILPNGAALSIILTIAQDGQSVLVETSDERSVEIPFESALNLANRRCLGETGNRRMPAQMVVEGVSDSLKAGIAVDGMLVARREDNGWRVREFFGTLLID